MPENQNSGLNQSSNADLPTSSGPVEQAESPKDTGLRASVGDIVQRAEHIGEQAKDGASEVVSHAKHFLDEQLGARTKKTAEHLGHLAQAILGAGEHIGDTFVTPYVHKLGAGLDQVATVLKEASVDDAVRRAESYARANPLVFLGGALVAGIAGGRVLKSVQAALAQDLDVDDHTHRAAENASAPRPIGRRTRAGAA